ncbi:putative Peptidase S16, lon-like [Nitrospira moscoviensis]|jgi:Lon protease-like protein|uniref:Putative Peptidase S16, lon-like n=2 Tax=Nitrospira moscoviensis TaxID=42253 RepID=A0A0K2G8J8_NITMO|nr:putative Peptidase S16, lon-like [Nitrospira moscoviensis]
MHIDHNREPSSRPLSSEKAEPFPIPERLPVFPLPNVVFFPKTYLPLHIFEPRYRRMVADATAGGQCIAMALLKEGWETDYYGNPPIYPVACVGRLVSVQPLPDGRSNILLQGLERCDITEEHFDKPYRQASVLTKPQAAEPELDRAVRRRLVEALAEYLQTREDSTAWQGFFRDEVRDEVLINTLSTYLDCTPLEKQFLLEADGLHQRARRLNDLIQFMLHDHHGAKGWE